MCLLACHKPRKLAELGVPSSPATKVRQVGLKRYFTLDEPLHLGGGNAMAKLNELKLDLLSHILIQHDHERRSLVFSSEGKPQEFLAGDMRNLLRLTLRGL